MSDLSHGVGGLPALPGGIPSLDNPAGVPSLDSASGMTPVSASFLTGQNGKERLSWASYAPNAGFGAFGHGYSPWGNLGHRDRTVASTIANELSVSDPTISTLVDILVTNACGTGLTLSAKVDALATGLSPDEARALNHAIETKWAAYCNAPTECDGGGRFTLHELAAQAFSSWLLTGETLTAIDVSRAPGGTMFTKATLLDSRMIDGGRSQSADGKGGIFQGVEFDGSGRQVALHLRRIPLGSISNSGVSLRVPMFSRWGRPKLIFLMEARFAGQIRGLSPLVAALTPAKDRGMLNELSVDSAAIQNAFSVTIESDAPAHVALQGLETHPEPQSGMAEAIANAQMMLREQWYGGPNGAKVRTDGAQVTHLASGDKLKMNQPAKNATDYGAFNKALVQQAARAGGVATPDLSGFWGDSNYAASRLEMALPHRLNLRRRRAIVERFMQGVFEAWLEETIACGYLELPSHAIPFWSARAGYCNAKWRGMGVVTADRKKEAEADVLELSNHLATLEDVLAARGIDLEHHVAQLQAERDMLKAAGLHPSYATQTQLRVVESGEELDDPDDTAPPKKGLEQ